MRGLKRVKHVQAKMGDLAKAVDELRQMRARRRLAQLGGIRTSKLDIRIIRSQEIPKQFAQ